MRSLDIENDGWACHRVQQNIRHGIADHELSGQNDWRIAEVCSNAAAWNHCYLQFSAADDERRLKRRRMID